MRKVDISKFEIAENPAIKLFAGKGYENIQKAEISNINEIYFATKDGQAVFIKKYANLGNEADANMKKSNNELACYENLPRDLLMDVVEINTDEHYLVLKKVDLCDIEKNQESVAEIVQLYFERLVTVDAAFLPEVMREDYEQLFQKMRSIEARDVIENAGQAIDLFRRNRDLIESSVNVFSHHDFNLHNIKRQDGKLVVFDFEYAGRDNAMCDMATFYTSIYGDKELLAFFETTIKKNELYDEKLFDLMVLRRCATVLHKYKYKGESDFFKKNLAIFNETLKKY